MKLSDLVSSDHLELLAPERIGPDSVGELRRLQAAGQPTDATLLGKVPGETFQTIISQIDAGRFQEASDSFNLYLHQVRSRHDLLNQYCWAYAGLLSRTAGQRVAVDGLRMTLSGCASYQMMWEGSRLLNPEELTAVLAEHLRVHFSGPGREGAVEILEEARPKRFRLLLDPCGSGGAMRRRALENPGEAFGLLPDPSPATWGKGNQVPAYCAHCAINESLSMEYFGYPLWVTEFNPDPGKPCGWTIYEDPQQIPEEYFTRLGASRDPSRFRAPGQPMPVATEKQ